MVFLNPNKENMKASSASGSQENICSVLQTEEASSSGTIRFAPPVTGPTPIGGTNGLIMTDATLSPWVSKGYVYKAK